MGGPEGVKIIPNPQRIQALKELRRPRNRKEVQVYLGTVRSLIKWFPTLNVSILIRRASGMGIKTGGTWRTLRVSDWTRDGYDQS